MTNATPTTIGGLPSPGAPQGSTLLSLVMAMTDATDSEEETIAGVMDELDSGRVFLTGNFRGCKIVLD